MTIAAIDRIYTDGACSGNPGPGGWGVVIYYGDGQVDELGEGEPQTTNNRMELQAAIAALERLIASGQTTPVSLYTDSEYVKKGITQWVTGWKRRDWKTSAGKPVLNQDLWQQLDHLHQQVTRRLTLEWIYVRGHSGDAGNDRCDAIARGFAQGQPPPLSQRQPSLNPTSPQPETTATKPIESTFTVNTQNFVASPSNSHYDMENVHPETNMADSGAPPATDTLDNLPREVRVNQLRNMLETLHAADEIAKQGYLITSSELADLMDVNASAVTSRGEYWAWRNWTVSRVRREGNQILWQLERID
ncbi:Ribonuclease H [Halomicronema hongdechloris C2206]|uniref:Ribonuclease H n=1 Tax=Halomicronema hongdechloris C2206 TaxID=1641165 RepID=A0A1Z3HM64_9CYAN|nr:ribonuclease HI [Halomicronema hongdechloris]ASC71380.1 Ribonuclease H [Halomicronema hongdechloris C2206]